jgi:hypothetical protein
MRFCCLVIVLAFLAANVSDSWGQSQSAPQRGQPKGNQAAQPAAPDQRGTDQSPLSVKILPSPDAKQQAEKQERDGNEKAENDRKLTFETERIADYTRWLSAFTLALFCAAIAQIVIFVRQLRLIRDSLGPAEKAANAAADAADAAKLNSQAVLDAERARIYVEANAQYLLQQIQRSIDYLPANTPEQEKAPLEQGERIEVTYVVENYGRTPAIIKEISHQLIVAKTLPSPRETSPVDPLPISHFLARETEAGISCNCKGVRTVKDARDVFGKLKTLWFYGYIAYDDTFGWGREFNYVWHYTGGMNAFHLYSFSETKSREKHKDYTG